MIFNYIKCFYFNDLIKKLWKNKKKRLRKTEKTVLYQPFTMMEFWNKDFVPTVYDQIPSENDFVPTVNEDGILE